MYVALFLQADGFKFRDRVFNTPRGPQERASSALPSPAPPLPLGGQLVAVIKLKVGPNQPFIVEACAWKRTD